MKNKKKLNTAKGDISDSDLNAGGCHYYTTSEMNKGAAKDPMLLKVISKPIKVMITCKILGPYLKNSARYRGLKNFSF